MNSNIQTALVTGATSGLGFEAAAQIAEEDVASVIITGRNRAKASLARDELVTRTRLNVFESLPLDLDDLESVEAAAQALVERGGQIDLLILNAGIAPPAGVTMSRDGIERTVSSSLVGHHVLTMRLLEHGLLGPNARIVIAGSEAARGDVPMFHPVDFHALAKDYFDGDLQAAIEAQMLMKPPAVYKSGDVYATAKVLVAWWVAELARRLPEGMTVNAVSPGSTPETNAVRNAPFMMRNVLIPMFKLVPGMSHGVADGAQRYLDVAEKDDAVSGRFYASPPRKVTGKIELVDLPHISNRFGQQAGWSATVKVSGVGLPDRVASTRGQTETIAA